MKPQNKTRTKRCKKPTRSDQATSRKPADLKRRQTLGAFINTLTANQCHNLYTLLALHRPTCDGDLQVSKLLTHVTVACMNEPVHVKYDLRTKQSTLHVELYSGGGVPLIPPAIYALPSVYTIDFTYTQPLLSAFGDSARDRKCSGR